MATMGFEMNKDQLFTDIDTLFNEYVYNISDEDRFTLIMEYQVRHLSKISDAGKSQSRSSIARTAMYELGDAIKRWKRNKSKNQLFKLVNIFSINCTEFAFDIWSSDEKLAWWAILSEKDVLIKNSDWYLRTMPESRWILEYIENKQG